MKTAWIWLLCLVLPTAWAEPAERDNVVNLNVELVRPLANDTLNAVMYFEDNDANPSRLAERVNGRINAAMAQARAYSMVKVSTSGVQTFPVYHDKTQKLIAWRTRVSLALESRDFAAAQNLIGVLQDKLAIESIDFSVSSEARQKLENALIAEVLAAFGERARLVQQGLGAKSWKVVNISVNSNTPRPQESYGRAMLMKADAAPMQLSAGESQLRLMVSGAIQLQP